MNYRSDEALKVLTFNSRLFPEVANGYDRLSEAYLISGNAEMAIHYARLCLEKLPFHTTANAETNENLRQINEDRLNTLGADSGKKNI